MAWRRAVAVVFGLLMIGRTATAVVGPPVAAMDRVPADGRTALYVGNRSTG